MTLTVTVLLGIGVLFIASSLDNTPIIETTQKILNNQPIDWTGQSASTTASTDSKGGTITEKVFPPSTGASGGNTTGRQFGQTAAS